MSFAVQLCLYALGLGLEVLVLAALLRGAYRRFPFVFAYVTADFLTTVLEIPSYVAYYTGVQATQRSRASYFWQDEFILNALVFLVVVSLVYSATAKMRSRRAARTLLLGAAVLVAGISFLVHYQSQLDVGHFTWANLWTRDLNFTSAILDLALWALLIASPSRDPALLMLSGGLGIQFTGEAIGASLRQLSIRHRSRATAYAGSMVTVVADLVCLYVWWRTFAREPRALKAGNPKD